MKTIRQFVDAFARGYADGQLRRYLLKALGDIGLLGVDRRYRLGLVDRAHMAYGLFRAAREARSLGYGSISAIEFGVGAGNGLLGLEEHAAAVARMTGTAVSVFGFDTGQGLPRPVDYRDVPYAWEAGFYPMDEAKLRGRLRAAQLIVGDVRSTVASFVEGHGESLRQRPIGFVSFDLDYWSSTLAAFDIFRGAAVICIPRVWCYFDDIPWTIEDIGELRAIRDFNQEPHGRRLRAPHSLRYSIPFRPSWADQIYQAHLFDHPDYGRLVVDRNAERVVLGKHWV
jgi:hypothetical protein